MSYQVKLDLFEGPFDLLLSFVSKGKLDIYEVPIASITRDYLGYIHAAGELDLELATEFLMVAATLLEIKAQGLLPSDEDAEEEELPPDEVRRLLIERLLEYKQFKNASAEFAAKLEAAGRFMPRCAGVEEQFAGFLPDFLEGVSVEDLALLFVSLCEVPAYLPLEAVHIQPLRPQVEKYVEILKQKLLSLGKSSFAELTRGFSRSEAVASFLAVLELHKQGELRVVQDEAFGEIVVVPLAGEVA